MSRLTLIGQYDSPFVRRVAVTMHYLEIPFERRPWSVFRDAEKIRRWNPLGRVPVLLLDEREALIESASILDYLESERAPGRGMTPGEANAARTERLRTDVALGACEKAVQLHYRNLAKDPSNWPTRLAGQLDEAVAWLDRQLPSEASTPRQSGITATVLLRFAREYLPQLAAGWPLATLGPLSEDYESRPPFLATPFESDESVSPK